MENNNKKYNITEIEISIRDLLMRICLKWRMMIVGAIAFAIIFNAVGIFQDYKSASIYEEQKKINSEDLKKQKEKEFLKNIEELKKGLTLREREEVERAVASYKNIVLRYNNLLKYGNESIKMQLDANSVSIITLQYNVDNHYKVEYPIIEAKDNTNAIVDALIDRICDDAVCNQIAKVIELNVDNSYIKELISTEKSGDNFTVAIYGRNKEECEKMSTILQEKIADEAKKIQNTFGGFDLNFILEKYEEGQNSKLLDDQTSQAVNLNNVKNAFNNLRSALNDKQDKYYYALLDSEKNEEDLLSEEQDSYEGDLQPVIISYIHIKMIILGVLLGVLLVCVVTAVRYLLTGCLRTRDDLTNVFGMEYLGTIQMQGEKKESKIDLDIKALFGKRNNFDSEEKLRMACSGIRIAAQKKQMDSIFVVSTDNESEVCVELEKIVSAVSKEIKTVLSGPSIVYDPESLEKMAGTKGVVLLEKIGSSRYEDIKIALEKCNVANVPVLGCVMIE